MCEQDVIKRIIVLLVAVGHPVLAYGLATEDFGDRPLEPSEDWPVGTLVVAEAPGRVYSQWVNGGQLYCYRGDAEAFGKILKKFAAIEAPAHRLYVEPGYGKLESLLKDKTVKFDWRLDVIGGLTRSTRIEKGATEEELSPRLTYYVGYDAREFEELILPENVEVIPSDELKQNELLRPRIEEASKWRTAKSRWAEFVESFLEQQRSRLRKTWPAGREPPIGGYVEFRSQLASKYLPDYKIYIIETSIGSISQLFAVSAAGEVSDLKGYHFGSMSRESPSTNPPFSTFIKNQRITVPDVNTAVEVGKFIEELVFAPDRWMYLRHNSNDFKVFKAWLFSKVGTTEDPNWRWFAEKCENGWIVSRRYVGPPASIMMPPRWKLKLDEKDRIIEVTH